MSPFTSDTYIVNGNITFFLGEHSEQFKQDILYSSLLVQLINTPSPNWFSNYAAALAKLHWTLNQINVATYPKEPYSLLDIVSKITDEILPEKNSSQLRTAFSAIADLPEEDPAMQAFLETVQSRKIPIDDEGVTFELHPMLTIVSENKKIHSLLIQLETTNAVSADFLVQRPQKKDIRGDIHTSLWTTYLVEAKYKNIRDKIISKLGSEPQNTLFPIHTKTHKN